MAAFPILTFSHRATLLGGVSLLAFQGLSACTHQQPGTDTASAPAMTAPAADAPVYQEYQPVDGGIVTTLAVGEEDGSGPIPVEPDGGIGDGAGPPGTVTTLAIGEEDGGYTAPSYPGTVTTLAIGEEDGSGPIPVEPDGGIGDGAGPPPGTATTLAIGEEDGGFTTVPVYPGTVTTLAVGEES